jgi:hypothetical protein
MYRFILVMLFAVATVALAQEDSSDDAATETTTEAADDATTEAADETTDDEFADLDLDRNDDHTQDNDEDFKPTDVVSYQQSVPFPPDI